MISILNLTKTNKLILAALAFLAVLAFGSGRAHAATLNVTGGCTLGIAINSVNAGANQSGCTAVGSYGSTDTITVPAGTQTLTGDLAIITEPVTITGAGMGSTIIDGDGQYSVFSATGSSFTLSGMKITNLDDCAVKTNNVASVNLQYLDVDGSVTVGTSSTCGILGSSSASSTSTYNASNIYIHDFTIVSGFGVLIFAYAQSNGGTTTSSLSNITLANISSTGGTALQGIGITADGSTANATITNVTVHNLISDGLTTPFVGAAISAGNPANTTIAVSNTTITGTRGVDSSIPVAGVPSAAFYSAGFASGSSDVANVAISVQNSLFADNLNEGSSNNCSTVSLNDALSGTGTVNASITSLGYNMSDDATCTGFTQTGDRQNVGNIVSTLGPLQDNGGSVPTRALLAGSPAIATGGVVLGVTTDARGVTRSSCPSIGAYQFEGAVCAATTTNANAGTNAGAPNTGANPVSLVGSLFASFAGLLTLGYVCTHKRA